MQLHRALLDMILNVVQLQYNLFLFLFRTVNQALFIRFIFAFSSQTLIFSSLSKHCLTKRTSNQIPRWRVLNCVNTTMEGEL